MLLIRDYYGIDTGLIRLCYGIAMLLAPVLLGNPNFLNAGCLYLCNMAKQTGPVKLEGTIGNICFYKMGDEYYARLKSSLKGKRVKKDPRFRRTMEFAGMLKQASRIASGCYACIPKEEREHAMYRALTGMAMQMLKVGISPEEITAALTPAEAEVTMAGTEVAPVKIDISISETAILPLEKFPLSPPRMLVDRNGQLIFDHAPLCLAWSKKNTVRPKAGHYRYNAAWTGIPFVPN